MGKPSPPSAPNPNTVAQQQTDSNEATAQQQSWLNNYNTSSPYGSVDWTQNPTTGQWTQSTSLSPSEQQIFNNDTGAQESLSGAAPNLASTAANAATGANPYAGLPGLQYSANGGQIQTSIPQTATGDQAVTNAENAAYNTETQYLNPQWQQATEQEQSNLANQGLNQNSAAYQNAMQIFGNQENQAYQGAANAAVTAGDAEQNTLYGQQLQSGEFANQAQAQGYGQSLDNAQLNNSAQQLAGQENITGQQLPLSELSSLLGTSGVMMPQAGQYTPTTIQPTNVEGAYSLADQMEEQNYQQQMQNYDSTIGSLFNLGAAGMMGGYLPNPFGSYGVPGTQNIGSPPSELNGLY
jgi:hypothetical protein